MPPVAYIVIGGDDENDHCWETPRNIPSVEAQTISLIIYSILFHQTRLVYLDVFEFTETTFNGDWDYVRRNRSTVS